MAMTKKELHEALWAKFEESRGYVAGAKTPDDIPDENVPTLIKLSGAMVNMIAQYVCDVLPICEWNDTHVVAALRHAAKMIESTLGEEAKGAIIDLERMMEECFSTTVVAIPGDIRDET